MTARSIAALGLVVCLGGASAFAPTPALAGGSRGKVLVVNNNSGSLTVIDTTKRAVQGNAPVGNRPTKVISDFRGSVAYVINTGSDSLSIVNLSNLAVIAFPLGFEPSDLALTPAATTLVILHQEHDIASGGGALKGDYSIVDLKQMEIVATNNLGGVGAGDPDPCGIVADNSGEFVWITSCATNKVVLIDLNKARQGDTGAEVKEVLDSETNPLNIAITAR